MAEREIVVEGTGYVFDSGRTQQRICDEIRFASRSQCRRRWLHAGRCRSGYFCLLPMHRAADLVPTAVPEISISLEEAILSIQLLEMGGIQQFLSLVPTPPSEETIANAVRRLQVMRALSPEDDELTPLGR